MHKHCARNANKPKQNKTKLNIYLILTILSHIYITLNSFGYLFLRLEIEGFVYIDGVAVACLVLFHGSTSWLKVFAGSGVARAPWVGLAFFDDGVQRWIHRFNSFANSLHCSGDTAVKVTSFAIKGWSVILCSSNIKCCLKTVISTDFS